MTGTNIPAKSFVGAVTNTGPEFPATSTGAVTTGSFQLVGQNGSPVDPAGPVSSITLSAEGDPSDLAPGQTPTRCSTPPSRRRAAATPEAS